MPTKPAMQRPKRARAHTRPRWHWALLLSFFAAEAFGQAEEAAVPTERHPVFPNLVVHIPQAALAAELNRSLSEHFLVDDVIVGTPVRGSGELTGSLTGRWQFNVGQGVVEMSLLGQMRNSTTSTPRKARVASTSVTQLQGTKRLVIDASGIHPLPATVTAQTHICYDTVNAASPLRRQLTRRSLAATRGCAEQESACKAAAYARSQFDETVDAAAITFNSLLQGKFIRPLASRQVWPQTHSVGSDDSGLTLAMLQPSPDHLGAPTPPPPFLAATDPQILIHSSFAEQTVNALIRGRTYSGDDLRQWLRSVRAAPATIRPNDDWTWTFPESTPFSVVFQDNAVLITLRLAGFHAQGRDFPATEISARYDVRKLENGLVLRKNGAFQIYPAGFDRGNQRLSGPQLATRDVLRRKLETLVAQEFVLGEVPGSEPGWTWAWSELTITEGWLSLAASRARQ